MRQYRFASATACSLASLLTLGGALWRKLTRTKEQRSDLLLLLHNLRAISADFCQVRARSAQSTLRRRCHPLLLQFYAAALCHPTTTVQWQWFHQYLLQRLRLSPSPHPTTTTATTAASASSAHHPSLVQLEALYWTPYDKRERAASTKHGLSESLESIVDLTR